jgi:D-tyrosyl-tRNA(Tyr) deacylase
MRTVLQRVSSASVTIDKKIVAEIGMGMLVLLGIEESDSWDDIEWLTGKIARLRIFPDEGGVMNRSVVDVNGDVLVVSQFTLHASTKKGNRPSYIQAARPETAIPLYLAFTAQMEKETGKKVFTGEFGAMMDVALVNVGPVTIIIDSKNKV